MNLYSSSSHLALKASAVPPHDISFSAGVWGVDVSKYQLGMNFKAAYDENARFAIIRCSANNRYYDPVFAEHYDNAMNAGLLVLAYHYVGPQYKAVDQIFTITNAIGTRQIAGLMLDFEVTNGQDRQVCTDIMWALAKNFKDIGTKKANLIYSTGAFWNANVNRSTHWKELAGSAVAHWGIPPSKIITMADWPTWDVWQAGQVTKRFGFKGDVDFCVWRESSFPGNVPPPPPPPPEVYVDLTGKSSEGDNFSGRIVKV